MKNIYLKGGFLVFLGAFFWSFNAPIVRILQTDPLFVVGIRSVIAGIVLLPFLRIKKLNWSFWIIIYFFSYCSLCISIVTALSMTSPVIAVGMQASSILWLFLFSLIVTKKIDSTIILPLIIITIGVVLFMTSEKSGVGLRGNLIAMTEGISFALMSISSKKCSGDNPAGLTCLANIFTGIFIFLVFPTSFSYINITSPNQWIFLLILGSVQVAGGYLLYNMGLKNTSPEKASILALWEMILGPVWVALFFKDYPSLQVNIGLLFIIIGIVLNAREPLIVKEKNILENK